MKRYRILPFFDFDLRVHSLTESINDTWPEVIKEQQRQNRASVIEGLKYQFGVEDHEQKVQNFIEIGPKPMSVVAFHNLFFSQVRSSFVFGSYYPALTGACALGERILNHLILSLREDFRSTVEYKRVYRKDSFDDWDLAINTLSSWSILLPEAEKDFRLLARKRNEALHFRLETEQNVRSMALEAVRCLQRIIGEQFSGLGCQPWFLTGVPGEIYIRTSWESNPFIRKVYLPNGPLVGYRHRIESLHPRIHIVDPDKNQMGPRISDEDFVRLRREFNDGGQKA